MGVTVDAVRGRIRRGTIDSEHDKDGKVYVWVEAPEADRPGPSATGGDESEASQSRSDAQEQLVESLLDQVAHMREQLAAEREANRENRRLLAAALERIPAIEPPETPGGPETPVEEPTGTYTGTEEGERETVSERPWWRRWFGG